MNTKTLLAAVAVSAVALSSAAFAGSDNSNGGFTGPGTEITVVSVQEAKGMNDDAVVVLQGNIQKKIGDELYLFSDGKETIAIEIDDDDWNGLNVGPDDVVEITGEVDKGWTSIEIDDDQIKKVNN